MRFVSESLAPAWIVPAICLGALFQPVGSAHAVTIETLATGAVAGTTITDMQGPAGAGPLLSQVSFTGDPFLCALSPTGDPCGDPVVPPFARAGMDESGKGAVEANGVDAGVRTVDNTLEARSDWSTTVTNTSSVPATFRYDFNITPASLRLVDFVGPVDPFQLGLNAAYAIEILLDGVPIFGSTAELTGGQDDHLLTETGTDLGGTLVGGPNIFGYDFDPFVGSLNLGTIAPGDSFTVAYNMTVEATFPGFETGAAARIGAEPNNQAGQFGQAGLPGLAGGIVAVPEPTTLLLLGLGLAGLGFAKRRLH